jgi:hypothetical protein
MARRQEIAGWLHDPPRVYCKRLSSRRQERQLNPTETMIMQKILIQASCFAALATAYAMPASAIECQGSFQVQRDGSTIATPYCQDSNLARVANEKGVRVSAAEIRENPNLKARVCVAAGEDNRVRETCDRYLDRTDN